MFISHILPATSRPAVAHAGVGGGGGRGGGGPGGLIQSDTSSHISVNKPPDPPHSKAGAGVTAPNHTGQLE